VTSRHQDKVVPNGKNFCLQTQFRERLEELVRRGAGHPKLKALVEALRRHFGGDCGAADAPEATAHRGGGGDGVCGGKKDDMGRAIVFTNLRESVATIVDTLALHAPLIKPRCVGLNHMFAHTYSC